MKCQNAQVIATVLRRVIDGGWEESLSWSTSEYDWNKQAVREALDIITVGRPIHNTRHDEYFLMATRAGHNPLVVPQWLYNVGRFVCGATTVMNILQIRDKDEMIVRSMNGGERDLLMQALRYLEEKMPWQDWRRGHLFKALDAEATATAGIHDDRNSDTVAINFAHRKAQTVRGVAKIIVHEIVHHVLGQNSGKDNWHGESFHRQLMELTLPPDN